MSKIYRLHSGANDTIQDWTQISSYLDTAQINKISDTSGANAKTRITSIPSPFACIDLVKTAFKNVTAGGTASGDSIFHKMVSDALDVGQVFFNSTRLLSKVEIVAWNPGLSRVGEHIKVSDESDLGQLLLSDSAQHKLYGETLKMFFSQDAAEYNFDHLQQFYLLNYKDGQGRFNIIGGTSPVTLFFASANKLDYVNLNFGNDKLFDNTYCPLQERSEDYILFLYALREAMPGFRSRFSVVDDYLELCLKVVPADTRKKIIELDSNRYEHDYESISLNGLGHHPEIIGHELRGLKINAGKPEAESDFVIEPTIPVNGLRPLVLPAYTFTTGLHYVDGKWPAQLKAPYFDPLPLTERTLPGQEIKYPYLTTSDFLEPYLIQLPFEPDQNNFFNGHLAQGGSDGYLLPIAPAFFNYFTAADLRSTLSNGKPMFELERLPGGAIKARLRLPVRNGRFIDMERIYVPDIIHQGYSEADVTKNQGFITGCQLSIVIYPFVKRGTDDHAAYTIMLLDHGLTHSNKQGYKLRYYKDTAPQQELITRTQRQKSHKEQDGIDTFYDVLHSEFDFITVEQGKLRGCLVPLFPEVKSNSNRKYAFAIDFGTTNTHIEYKVDDEAPRAFDITAQDRQLGMLHTDNDATRKGLISAKYGKGATLLLENVPKEMMPEQVGGNAKYKFPRRTVVSESSGIDLNIDTYPLADFSIYWQYEDGLYSRSLRSHTNLKWGNIGETQEFRKRIAGYIANLVLLIRNKVVLNGGSLAKTSITWFYPTSMSGVRLNEFERIWQEQIERYMGKNIEIISIPESIAPFYFFHHKEGIRAGNNPVVNIDIGGGTTDIVVYKNESVTAYTSFRFAGNALFGDGYGQPVANNGFAQFFERNYRNTLNNTDLGKYLPVPENVQRSDDFITTLFGLQHHPDRREVSFSFTEQLRETDELKIVPLLFISSIFYHVARFQKGNMPGFLTFSGTASKVLFILDSSKGLKSVTKLANRIFNDVMGRSDANIKLVIAEGPKEVTAKGGLCNPVVPSEPKRILFGTEDRLGDKILTYKDAHEEITQQAVLKEVEAFIDLFFSWNAKLDFNDTFALNTRRLSEFKEILKAELSNALVEGIGELVAEMNKEEDAALKETLFFMPLKGGLHRLASYIILDN